MGLNSSRKIAYVAFVRRQVDIWGSVVVVVIVDMWGSVVVVVIVDKCGMCGAVWRSHRAWSVRSDSWAWPSHSSRCWVWL